MGLGLSAKSRAPHLCFYLLNGVKLCLYCRWFWWWVAGNAAKRRLDCNADSKLSSNTYLNTIKLYWINSARRFYLYIKCYKRYTGCQISCELPLQNFMMYTTVMTHIKFHLIHCNWCIINGFAIYLKTVVHTLVTNV